MTRCSNPRCGGVVGQFIIVAEEPTSFCLVHATSRPTCASPAEIDSERPAIRKGDRCCRLARFPPISTQSEPARSRAAARSSAATYDTFDRRTKIVIENVNYVRAAVLFHDRPSSYWRFAAVARERARFGRPVVLFGQLVRFLALGQLDVARARPHDRLASKADSTAPSAGARERHGIYFAANPGLELAHGKISRRIRRRRPGSGQV